MCKLNFASSSGQVALNLQMKYLKHRLSRKYTTEYLLGPKSRSTLHGLMRGGVNQSVSSHAVCICDLQLNLGAVVSSPGIALQLPKNWTDSCIPDQILTQSEVVQGIFQNHQFYN